MTGRGGFELPRYYKHDSFPVKMVETPGGGLMTYNFDVDTGGWKKANDLFDEIIFAHGGETDRITREQFVQLVESERAAWLTGVGPIFALYETVKAIEAVAAVDGDRALTPTEKALVAGTRRRTYAMFEAELAGQGDPGADLEAAREAGWTEGSAPVLPSTRVGILREGERVRADIAALNAAAARGEAVDGVVLAAARERLRALRAHYREWLPVVPVSRCPDTGAVVVWRLDDVDFDGWFWEYHQPLRVTPKLPPTWRAMTGAVRLSEVIGAAPFIAKPGPEVPYVVPRILNEPDVRAVIAQVRISPHTGWAITYYAPRRLGVPLANLWGADDYPVYEDDGTWLGWDEVPEWPADNDYDLRPWVLSGKLLWIAPDDEKMTLRQGVDGCPFLDFSGRREYGIVERGEVRYPPLPPSASPPP